MNYTVYTDKEIMAPEFQWAIDAAREMWRTICEENLKYYGQDYGSCVLGAGIVVTIRAKRKRNTEDLIVINPPTTAQGSCVWERNVQEVIDFLRRRGIDAHYKYGWLD